MCAAQTDYWYVHKLSVLLDRDKMLRIRYILTEVDRCVGYWSCYRSIQI